MHTYHNTVSAQKNTKEIDVREKQGTRGGRRSALVPHPQMIAPDEALPARAENVVPKVVSVLIWQAPPRALA
jgi:hypothetical protein